MVVVASVSLVAPGMAVPAGGASANPAASRTHETIRLRKIRDAMSAAPRAIAGQATILDYASKPGGPEPVLRKGTNGWTCYPDYPGSPGDDPWCLDQHSMEWWRAYSKGENPKLAAPGISYMLRGGSDPSNTDPAATKPPAGKRWLSTPPHIMIFPAGPLDPAVYGTTPNTGRPWIMWADTPYAHLMIPVK
jgi:hypothetical protein